MAGALRPTGLDPITGSKGPPADGHRVPPPLLVEFLGLPGSGKTTLAVQVSDWLVGSGKRPDLVLAAARKRGPHRIREDAEALGYLALHDPSGLVYSWSRLGRASGYRPREWILLGLNLCAHVARRHRLQGRPGIHLIDQGVYQLLWSLAFRYGAEVLEGVARTQQYAPDVVVLIGASRGRVASRLAGRGGSNRLSSQLEEGEDSSHVFDRGEAALAAVVALLRRGTCRCKLLEVDNDGAGLAELAAVVGRHLLEQTQATEAGE